MLYYIVLNFSWDFKCYQSLVRKFYSDISILSTKNYFEHFHIKLLYQMNHSNWETFILIFNNNSNKTFFIKSNWIEHKKWIILTSFKASFEYFSFFFIKELIGLDRRIWYNKWRIPSVYLKILFEYFSRIKQKVFHPYVILHFIRTEWFSVRKWLHSVNTIFTKIRFSLNLSLLIIV